MESSGASSLPLFECCGWLIDSADALKLVARLAVLLP